MTFLSTRIMITLLRFNTTTLAATPLMVAMGIASVMRCNGGI